MDNFTLKQQPRSAVEKSKSPVPKGQSVEKVESWETPQWRRLSSRAEAARREADRYARVYTKCRSKQRKIERQAKVLSCEADEHNSDMHASQGNAAPKCHGNKSRLNLSHFRCDGPDEVKRVTQALVDNGTYASSPEEAKCFYECYRSIEKIETAIAVYSAWCSHSRAFFAGRGSTQHTISLCYVNPVAGAVFDGCPRTKTCSPALLEGCMLEFEPTRHTLGLGPRAHCTPHRSVYVAKIAGLKQTKICGLHVIPPPGMTQAPQPAVEKEEKVAIPAAPQTTADAAQLDAEAAGFIQIAPSAPPLPLEDEPCGSQDHLDASTPVAAQQNASPKPEKEKSAPLVERTVHCAVDQRVHAVRRTTNVIETPTSVASASGLEETSRLMSLIQGDAGPATGGFKANPQLTKNTGHEFTANEIILGCDDVHDVEVTDLVDSSETLPSDGARCYADIRHMIAKDSTVNPDPVVLQSIRVVSRITWQQCLLALSMLACCGIPELIEPVLAYVGVVLPSYAAIVTHLLVSLAFCITAASLLRTRSRTYLIAPSLSTAIALKHPEPGGLTRGIIESYIASVSHRANLRAELAAAVVRDTVDFWYSYGDRSFIQDRAALLHRKVAFVPLTSSSGSRAGVRERLPQIFLVAVPVISICLACLHL